MVADIGKWAEKRRLLAKESLRKGDTAPYKRSSHRHGESLRGGLGEDLKEREEKLLRKRED